MCKECQNTRDRVIQQAEALLDDLVNLPDRAGEFKSSVREKTESMLKWINDNQHVTEKMAAAIANMAGGAKKWQTKFE